MGNGKRQILIEIPEDRYETLKMPSETRTFYLDFYQRLIVNGILLPEGHGDLVDVKEYLKDVCGWFDSDDCCDHDCKNCEFVTRIAELFEHIVIKADKEGAKE